MAQLFQRQVSFPSYLVREYCVDTANALFTNVKQNSDEYMQQMIISGTPGTGKSFFSRYLV